MTSHNPIIQIQIRNKFKEIQIVGLWGFFLNDGGRPSPSESQLLLLLLLLRLRLLPDYANERPAYADEPPVVCSRETFRRSIERGVIYC